MWVSAHCGFHPPPKTPICSKLGDVFSQFPTVPTHKQAHSEGLIAAKLLQEKKKKGVGA